MKIPTSSSIILATLAISSSSTSLAAPTGDGTTDGGISHMRGRAESLHHVNQVVENEERADMGMMKRDLGELQGRDGVNTIAGLLGGLPLVGPIIQPLLQSAQSADIGPAEYSRLEAAISTASGILETANANGFPLAGLPVPNLPVPNLPIPNLPVPNLPIPNLPLPTTGLPLPIQAGDVDSGANPSGPQSDAGPAPTPAAAGDPSDNGSSFLISPTTTIANAEEAAPTQDPDYLSSAPASGTGTASPGVPAGPPNTPNPVNAPASG